MNQRTLTFEPPSDAAPPAARLLARPEARTLIGYTRRPLVLSALNKIGVFTYSSVGAANWLFLIDIEAGDSERFAVPNGEKASHGAALGADGNIYTFTHEQHLHRFIVGESRWETLAPVLPGGPDGQLAWDAIGAPDGCIYVGTYPDTCFGQYNTRTGEFLLIRNVASAGKYLMDFHVLPDGKIDCRGIGERKTRHVFDPDKRAFVHEEPFHDEPGWTKFITDPLEEAMPKATPLEGDERVVSMLMPGGGGARLALCAPSGWICSVDAQGASHRLMQGPAGMDVWRLVAIDDHTLCGLGATGAFFRADLRSHAVVQNQIDNRSADANTYFYFCAPSPRWAVGGHYSQQNVFRVDLSSGEWADSPFMITSVPGEPCTCATMNGKVYLGIYIKAHLLEYDPEKPFAYGINPRRLLQAGHLQHRPRGMAVDGRFVYMASWSDFCTIEGALTIYDTQTGTHEVKTNLLPGLNLDKLTYDAQSHSLIGGTFRWGDGDSAPPRRSAAVVYEWDVTRQKIVREASPWPDADLTQVLGLLPDGTVVAWESRKEEVALLARPDLTTIYRGKFPGGVLHAVKRTNDGRCYGLSSQCLFRWENHRMTPLWQNSLGCAYFDVPSPGVFALASYDTVYRLDLAAEA
jgi:hypothetical protein